MTSRPKISVIVPCHNVHDLLPDAVASALQQSYPNLEVVIVDDGSGIHCQKVTAGLVDSDARVSCVRHDTRRGPGAARWSGVLRAQGVYVAFLDADDIWHRHFLDLLEKTLSQSDSCCVGVFAWSRVFLDGEAFETSTRIHNPAAIDYHLAEMLQCISPPGNGSSLLMRGERLCSAGPFLDIPQGQDTEMWLRMLSTDPAMYFRCVPIPLLGYRRHSRAIGAQTPLSTRISALELFLSRYLPFVRSEERWKVLASFAAHAEVLGSRERADQWYDAALELMGLLPSAGGRVRI